jgi:probable F420-dependent oxidoreductase
MKFGLSLITRGPLAKAEHMTRFVQRAEALGYDWVSISDHIVIPKAMPSNYPYHPDGEFDWRGARDYYEPLATLMFLAGRTTRLRLGTSVLILPYRNPVTVAKMVATVDALSGGRVFLGVGTGWWEDEFKALGLPGHFAERGPRTDEYIRIFRNLWLEENPRFDGQFYQYGDLEFSPKPVQPGGVPIWVGGHTRRALRRTAELGDAWHPIGLRPPAGLTPAQLGEKRGELHRLCEQAGRDPATLQIALRCPLTFTEGGNGTRTHMQGAPAQIVEDIAAYAAQGVGQIGFDLAGNDIETLLTTVERIAAEVVPHVR